MCEGAWRCNKYNGDEDLVYFHLVWKKIKFKKISIGRVKYAIILSCSIFIIFVAIIRIHVMQITSMFSIPACVAGGISVRASGEALSELGL